MRLVITAIALSACTLNTAGVMAQPSKPRQPGATQPGVKAPTRPVRADKKAQDLLKAAGDAMALVDSFAYRASLAGEGDVMDSTPRYGADVVASRAEAGGWRLYVKGEVTPAGAKKQEFEIGFDGVTARSIRHEQQEVVEKSFTDMGDLPTFFASQQARPVVAWELIGEKPFASLGARASYEGVKTIDGESLDVVFVAGEGENAAGGDRFFFGLDKLPRRIEQVPDMAKDGMRVLTLASVRTNAEAPRVTYALPIPDDYRVRIQPKTPSTPREPAARTPNRPEQPGKPKAASNGLLEVGTDAPDWTFKDPTGKEHTLSAYKGKVVVMDFWAVWCGPCKAAMPSVQRLHKKYEKSGKVAVFGMNVWERPTNDPAKFMRDSGYSYGLLLNADDAAGAYKVRGIPAFYVIGTDGKILWNAVGHSPSHEKEISEVIDKALNAR